ncbi:MAG: glycosyltransferase family 39 protein [Lentisphaeria bacterium]|nr:glycosyltransferase family 39 protein [Lentisphaeria bacterium]
MNRKQLYWSYGGLFLLALVLRLVMAFFANCDGEIRTVRPDTAGYLTPARSLIAGTGYASTRRPPGLPVVAAAVFKCGGGVRTLSFLLAGVSALTVLLVSRAGYLYKGHAGGLTAGLLYALNPTVLGNAPLLLTDTLAGIFAALQYIFFLEFYRRKQWWGFFACAGAAAVGTLIRPVNMLFILPLIFLLLCMKGINWQKKVTAGVISLLLFASIIFPWMLRNAMCGAGFCVDTNTGAMYHQNGAMLLGEVSGRGYEFEKQRILREQEELFQDKVRFPDEKSREEYRINACKTLVKQHFFIWLKQQMNYQILLPDVPSFLECLGVTSSDRGTMAVLKEQGVAAAVRHYFGKNWLGIVAAVLPLIFIAGTTYAGALGQLILDVKQIRKNYMELFIFAAFVYYYLFLPGAITAPRYQIPALPCMCVMAASAWLTAVEYFRNRRAGRCGDGNTELTEADRS